MFLSTGGNQHHSASLHLGIDIIVIASSAGGIVALKEMLSVLPKDFPIPILVVQHLCQSSHYRSVLDKVLLRSTKLDVKWAKDGEWVSPATVYIAPQDHHTRVQKGGRIRLSGGKKINGFQPSADPLFVSAAQVYGAGVAGVVLSGGLADGTEGAALVLSAGGQVFAQSEESCIHPCMPRAATVRCDLGPGFSPRDLGALLVSLTLSQMSRSVSEVCPNAASLTQSGSGSFMIGFSTALRTRPKHDCSAAHQSENVQAGGFEGIIKHPDSRDFVGLRTEFCPSSVQQSSRSKALSNETNRIFVVDDEPIIAMTLAMILQQSGFEVKSFTSPLEALASAGVDEPTLLVSDVMMPELSGIELAIQLQRKLPSCRVLLFSGQAATADLLNMADVEGHRFEILSKPVHPKDLLAGIRRLTELDKGTEKRDF